jgi:hypothetical protein
MSTSKELMAGLRQLADDFSELSSQVSSSGLCANPSVTSSLSTAVGTGRLRDVAAKLRGRGLQYSPEAELPALIMTVQKYRLR